jgi:DNA-directed RNA polymerase specialized sigma24 family protein
MTATDQNGRDPEFAGWAAARRPTLVRGAFLLCGDWATAEDLVQEALVKVYLAWPKVVVRSPDAYARQVVLNAYLDLRRRPWRRRERSSELVPDQPAGTGAGTEEVAALQAALRDSRRGNGRPSCCGTGSGCPSRRPRGSWAAPRAR